MGSIRDKALDDYDDGKRLKASAKEWLDSGSENIYEAEDIIKAQQATIDKLVEALEELVGDDIYEKDADKYRELIKTVKGGE